ANGAWGPSPASASRAHRAIQQETSDVGGNQPGARQQRVCAEIQHRGCWGQNQGDRL
ncbi:hypothetical protein V8C86DRAFT_3129793, partial [Haematococcus lacustris]